MFCLESGGVFAKYMNPLDIKPDSIGGGCQETFAVVFNLCSRHCIDHLVLQEQH